MDFPLFFLDVVGNRLLFAVVAVTHVLVNHPLAVGAYPLVVALEWWGWRRGDKAIDEIARRATFVFFIITTTLGALTGVGIWLTAALISPFSIGSMLRVFFWAWFAEWLVFVSEVVLVLAYYLLWKKWSSGRDKKKHIALGVTLGVMSWVTMMIITAILSFMMSTGDWMQTGNFWDAFLNPIYPPQLAFRSFVAFTMGGLAVWFLLFFYTKGLPDLRRRSSGFVARWVLIFTLPTALAALWYRSVIPQEMALRTDVALLTQAAAQWYDQALIVIAVAIGSILLTLLLGAIKPRWLPRVALLIPFVLSLWMLGHFERVREFIRKPWVIADYMYSNGFRDEALPIYKRDGILPYATYVKNHKVTSSNRISAGEDVFVLACSRCHTTSGVNGVINKFTTLYGDGQWDDMAMGAFVQTMQNSRPYMPPFPGNEDEAEALIAYVKDLRAHPRSLMGVQMQGLPQQAGEALESPMLPEGVLP